MTVETGTRRTDRRPRAGALDRPTCRRPSASPMSPSATGRGSRSPTSTSTVPAGSLLAVIGPNGAGKSTLLKTIAGLLPPFAGTVEVLGGPPRREARRIAYVPQAELVDWGFPVTVGDVVMMGRVPLIGIGRTPGATTARPSARRSRRSAWPT